MSQAVSDDKAPESLLHRELTLELVRGTERAAVAASRLRGRGDDGRDGGGCETLEPDESSVRLR